MSVFIKNIFRKFIFGWMVFLLILVSINKSSAQDTVHVPTIEEYVEDEEEGEYQQTTLTTDTPVLRHVPLPLVDSLKKSKVFEYANDPEYWVKETKTTKPGFWDFVGKVLRNEVFRWFIYILLGSFLLWAFYKIIISNNLFLFYSKNKKLKDESVEEEIQLEEATLDERIAKLIAERNYRPAIRYLYIKVLQQLNEKGWITYHAQATNFDYIRQMSNNKLAPDFRFLTQVYEYVWYGEFDLTDEHFTIAHNRFNHFLNRSKPWEER